MLLLFLLFLAVITGYLTYENISLKRQLAKIPLRIGVTGTRGKSSVVRMLASVLREEGKKVLAKTTGAKAKYILPDGREETIKRRGLVSVMEQKKLIKRAAGLGAECLVAEIMSIQPENHYIESNRLLKPHILLITNIRKDHTDAMGVSSRDIAKVYCLDITRNSKVFISEENNRAFFKTRVKEQEAEMFLPKDFTSAGFFSQNLNLVYNVCSHLNISKNLIKKGIAKTSFDLGAFKIWLCKINNKTIYFANSFAMNDPSSTLKVLEKVLKSRPLKFKSVAGLVNLRHDRGDRTRQWIDYLQRRNKFFNQFFITGGHAAVFKKRVNNSRLLKSRKAEEITSEITAGLPDLSIVWGLANLKGCGEGLVSYWGKIGEEYEL